MLKGLSFKAKLGLLCCFMAGVSTLISGVAFVGLRGVSHSYEKVAFEAMPNAMVLNDMFLAYQAIRINLRSLGLNGLTPEQAQTYVDATRAQIEKYEALNAEFSKGSFEPSKQELYAEVNAAWTYFKGVGLQALKLHSEGTPAARAKLNEIFLHVCPDAAKRYNLAIDKLEAFEVASGKDSIAKAQSTTARTNLFVLVSSVLGTLSGLLVGLFFAQSVSRVISNVATNLSSTAESILGASGHIAQSSQSLSQSTTQQAASLQETAASLEEITAMIVKASESAHSVAENSVQSQQRAEEGKAAVGDMLTSMEEISRSNESILEQIHESNRKMSEIVDVIQEIGNRTKVINDIVFQTKLLSFNASVEAARAGESGKGFAVVAEEVGNLANMSGDAAKEIAGLLVSSTAKVEKIVQDTKGSVENLIATGKGKVSAGVSIAQQCSGILAEIVLDVTRVSSLSRDISQATKEQSLGVSEINKAVAQLDAVTQRNSHSSAQAAGAGRTLSDQARTLNSAVQELLFVIHGRGHIAGAKIPRVQPDATASDKKRILLAS